MKYKKYDLSILLFVFILIAIGIIVYYYFIEKLLAARLLWLFFVFGISIFLISKTSYSLLIKRYYADCVIELRRIVWPSKNEMIQSVIAVLSMVSLVGLMLWSIDSILISIVGKVIASGV